MAVPDVKVRLSPEGVKEVALALRRVQQDANRTARAGAGGINELIGAYRTLKSLLPALGVGAVVGSIIGIGKSSIDTADQVGKMGQKVVASSENLSILQHGAKTADLATEDLGAGLTRLVASLGELRRGAGESVPGFERLGLSARDFAGKDTVQAFDLIARRLATISDEGERVETVLSIFGKRAGAKLVPLLNDLATKGFDAIAKSARDANAVLSNETTDAAQKFNDNLELIKVQAGSFARELAAEMLPGLAKFVAALRAAQVAGGGLFRAVILQMFTDTENLGAELEKVNKEISEFGTGPIPPGLVARKKFIEEMLVLQAEFNSKGGGVQRGRIGFEESDPTSDAQARLKQIEGKVRARDVGVLREQASAADAAAQAELRLAAALATTDQQRTLVEAAEVEASRRRTQGARAVLDLQIRLLQAREQALSESALKTIENERERQTVLQEIERQGTEKRIALARGYAETLRSSLQGYTEQYASAVKRIQDLDRETGENRKRAAQSIQDLELGLLSEQEQRAARIALAEQKIAQVRAAAAAGDIEKARAARAEAEGLALEVARASGPGIDRRDSINRGRSLLDAANSAFEAAAQKQKQLDAAIANSAQENIERIRQELQNVQTFVSALTARALKLEFQADEKSLQSTARQISEFLAAQTFTVQVRPVISDTSTGSIPSAVPGFATGGRLGGSSPGPRADNLLFKGTAGEYVQPVAAVRKYGLGLMESIRSLRYPAFADGGLVGDVGGSSAEIPAQRVELSLTLGGKKAGSLFGPPDTVREVVEYLEKIR